MRQSSFMRLVKLCLDWQDTHLQKFSASSSLLVSGAVFLSLVKCMEQILYPGKSGNLASPSSFIVVLALESW